MDVAIVEGRTRSVAVSTAVAEGMTRIGMLGICRVRGAGRNSADKRVS